jgi:phytanoyl-CoA hydroxylase
MISERDIARYQETGYLVVPDVVDAALLGRLRGALDALVANAASVNEHTDVYDLEPGHTPANPKVRRIKMPHSHTPVFWELAQKPRPAND